MNDSYKSDISLIEKLQTTVSGIVIHNSEEIEAQLKFNDGVFYLAVNKVLDIGISQYSFSFYSSGIQLLVKVSFTEINTSIKGEGNRISRYSEGAISSFNQTAWSSLPGLYRGYYLSEWRFLYDICGNPNSLQLLVDGTPIQLHRIEDYLIIENESPVSFEKFSELSYNILVALGFVSGKFIQDDVFIFRRNEEEPEESFVYKYKKLRPGYTSIYHALTGNPYSYDGMIGKERAERMYRDKTLKYLDNKSLSSLSELIFKKAQIQYALVLFIEANSKGSSLLIRNNCFFVVLEVLKKYFHDEFKSNLPKDYSREKNIDKFKLVFDFLFPISTEELDMIRMRNVFMHGDIEELEGDEMLSIMQKQLTFIYKLILSFVGFDGYIIDHFAIRNNLPDRAFIKIN